MKKILKKLLYVLQLFDFIWSVPLSMLAFVLFGVLLQSVFTNPDDPQGAPGFFDPSFLQVAFYATAMQVFLNACVWGGIFFNFKGIWKYYTGAKNAEGKIDNKSKDDFNALSSWQRIKILIFFYCFLSVEWLFLFNALL